MSQWEETSYPVPVRPLRVSCLSCGVAIAGGVRGSANIRSILKEIKGHDEEHHPPYDQAVIAAVATAVAELNDDLMAPRRTSRLSIDWAGSSAVATWRHSAEVLERHIGVLVEQRGDLERALQRVTRERDDLRVQLVEALKQIDVLTAVRDGLGAELRKAQPGRRSAGWFAELAKVTAGALVGAISTVGMQAALDGDDVGRHAATVVEHADVVISDCRAGAYSPP